MSSPEIGAWEVAGLKLTAESNYGAGMDAGCPDKIRFLAGVAKLIRNRLDRSPEKSEKRTAFFILNTKSPMRGSSLVDCKRANMLDQGKKMLGGKVWSVSVSPYSGRWINNGSKDDDDVFTEIASDPNLQDLPSIVFDPEIKPAEIRYYESGLADPDVCRVVGIDESNLSLDTVLNEINDIHRGFLVTPDSHGQTIPLWNSKAKHWPFQEAELRIQDVLRIGLKSKFPTANFRSEQPTTVGRVDIECEKSLSVSGGSIKFAILELKVLRSFSSNGKTKYSDGKTLSDIEEGVEQANAYREEKSALSSALCCFDMRKGNFDDSCFDHVKDLAKKLSVVLKRWRIFTSSKERRHQLASEAT